MRGGPIALVAVLGVAACGKGVAAPASNPTRYGEVRWEGLLQPTPDLLVVVRPQALRQDIVYGALVARAIDLAREHSPSVMASGTLEAMEDAEEVIVGERDSGPEATGDLFVVVRGVRGNVDPANLVDEMGRALWRTGPEAPAANVRELLRAPAAGGTEQGSPGTENASLFELPGRTWVIATGRARGRARDALALPTRTGSAAPSDPLGVSSTTVAFARLSGPALVAHVRALRSPGLLAPLGHDLRSVTVLLPPGEEAVVRTTLTYTSEQAVAIAETTLRHALAAMIAAKLEDYEWLGSATVQGSRCCIVVTAPVPGPPGAPNPSKSRAAPARSRATFQLPL